MRDHRPIHRLVRRPTGAAGDRLGHVVDRDRSAAARQRSRQPSQPTCHDRWRGLPVHDLIVATGEYVNSSGAEQVLLVTGSGTS